MSTAKQLLLMGLPATGKTTLVAALWHLVESKEVERSLSLQRLEGDRTALNQLRDLWMNATAPERTEQDTAQPVVLQLVPTACGAPFSLHIPDMAGETYRSQWVHRQWTQEHAERVEKADGILLAIHTKIRKPTLLCEIQSAFNGEPPQPPAGKKTGKPASARAWEPEHASTQVMLVDLLQFAVAARTGREPLRVAVLFTAWDLVPAPVPKPEDWLEQELPLLAQYLHSNAGLLTIRCYGVSAQGGDYTKAAERRALADQLLHSERINITGPDCAPHDLTAPIFWLLA